MKSFLCFVVIAAIIGQIVRPADAKPAAPPASAAAPATSAAASKNKAPVTPEAPAAPTAAKAVTTPKKPGNPLGENMLGEMFGMPMALTGQMMMEAGKGIESMF